MNAEAWFDIVRRSAHSRPAAQRLRSNSGSAEREVFVDGFRRTTPAPGLATVTPGTLTARPDAQRLAVTRAARFRIAGCSPCISPPIPKSPPV